MKEQQKITTKIMSTLVSRMIDRDTYEWPPKCSFITYQPQRPAREVSAESKKSDNK